MPVPGPDVAMLPVDNPLLLTVGIMLASLLQILDSTIANVAIPHMQSALGATPDTITWALTSYIVATAVAMPMTGWLSDRIGSRNEVERIERYHREYDNGTDEKYTSPLFQERSLFAN